MNRLGLAAAGCALLLVAACAAVPSSDAAPDPQRLSVTSTGGGETSTRNHRVLEDGLSITVSPPKVFTPTETASPRADRAVAFELTIDNGGTDVYRPSQLSITATCNGAAALQVIDSTQGYTGFLGADEVPPGEHLRISVAFAISPEPAGVTLTARPNAADGGGVVLFQGTV